VSTEDDPDPKPKSRWLYRLCVTLGVIGCTIGLCSGLFFLMAPTIRGNADYLSFKGTMKQLTLGVHNYNDSNGTLPGPFDDRNGRVTEIPQDPRRRLSWRAAVLPFVEEDGVFRMLDPSQPWDGSVNSPATSLAIRPYTDPADGRTSTHTPFRVFHDNGALWDTDPKNRIPPDKIPDGASNTILIAESTVQVPWAQFNEHPFDPNGSLPELGRASRNTFLVAMADGSVRVVKKSVSANTLRAAITRDGGESLGPDW